MLKASRFASVGVALLPFMLLAQEECPGPGCPAEEEFECPGPDCPLPGTEPCPDWGCPDVGYAVSDVEFSDLDKDDDGVIAHREVEDDDQLEVAFKASDANADGYLTPAEFEALKNEVEATEQRP